MEWLPLIYNPSPDITVDECLVAFREHCPFKQYMPSKPSKYGIKIWAACDARKSYAWNMQVHTGIPADNFFTSYAHGQELLPQTITMVGSVRRNKPELPPALFTTKDRDRFPSQFTFTDTHTHVLLPEEK
jgi:hypothetical protein